ncbi:alpha/beta hydrolase family protein [Ningiella sp. W23]|uniref:alpha/beta hydrolase family protein n=1 Tax=Ningiella sp. W23 TaxID=3023715 RepID=UPI003758457F
MKSQNDHIPPTFYYGDREEGTLSFLFSPYPLLKDIALSEHEKVSFKTRDGLTIDGYLTLPLKGEAPYPTVIHPHGGPGARDYSGFDTYASYLTNRGYAVFRPNFRGSTGYGFEFAQAQMGRWGLEMQDDITDAAQYLIEQGIAAPERLCIFGSSYGGYAAAMATVKTPDLFACSVSFAGISDLRALAKRISTTYVGGKLSAQKQIGKSFADQRARSPINGIDAIKTPILLIHGEDDIIMNVEQSRDFADELKDAGKEFKYVELEYGDHYLSIQENRTRFFQELDAFLAQHLKDNK